MSLAASPIPFPWSNAGTSTSPDSNGSQVLHTNQDDHGNRSSSSLHRDRQGRPSHSPVPLSRRFLFGPEQEDDEARAGGGEESPVEVRSHDGDRADPAADWRRDEPRAYSTAEAGVEGGSEEGNKAAGRGGAAKEQKLKPWDRLKAKSASLQGAAGTEWEKVRTVVLGEKPLSALWQQTTDRIFEKPVEEDEQTAGDPRAEALSRRVARPPLPKLKQVRIGAGEKREKYEARLGNVNRVNSAGYREEALEMKQVDFTINASLRNKVADPTRLDAFLGRGRKGATEAGGDALSGDSPGGGPEGSSSLGGGIGVVDALVDGRTASGTGDDGSPGVGAGPVPGGAGVVPGASGGGAEGAVPSAPPSPEQQAVRNLLRAAQAESDKGLLPVVTGPDGTVYSMLKSPDGEPIGFLKGRGDKLLLEPPVTVSSASPRRGAGGRGGGRGGPTEEEEGFARSFFDRQKKDTSTVKTLAELLKEVQTIDKQLVLRQSHGEKTGSRLLKFVGQHKVLERKVRVVGNSSVGDDLIRTIHDQMFSL